MNKEQKKMRQASVEAFGKMLESIYNVCESSAKEFDAKSVPLTYLKQTHEVMLKEMKKEHGGMMLACVFGIGILVGYWLGLPEDD